VDNVSGLGARVGSWFPGVAASCGEGGERMGGANGMIDAQSRDGCGVVVWRGGGGWGVGWQGHPVFEAAGVWFCARRVGGGEGVQVGTVATWSRLQSGRELLRGCAQRNLIWGVGRLAYVDAAFIALWDKRRAGGAPGALLSCGVAQ